MRKQLQVRNVVSSQKKRYFHENLMYGGKFVRRKRRTRE